MTLEPTTASRDGEGRTTPWLMLDRSRATAWSNGRRLELRRKEFDLLAFLVDNVDRYVTRDEILEAVWDDRFGTCTNTLHVHLSRLRSKLGESPASPTFVHTCRRRGVLVAGRRAHTFNPSVELYVARPASLVALHAA